MNPLMPFADKKYIEAIPFGLRPVERPAGTGYPIVPKNEVEKRLVDPSITARNLYSNADFHCIVVKHHDGTYAALSNDFPETCGSGRTKRSALRMLVMNAESVLTRALKREEIYRVPLNAPMTLQDIASILGEDYLKYVKSITQETFQVFSAHD